MTPAAISTIIDRAVVLARQAGVADAVSPLRLRRDLAQRVLRELREQQLHPERPALPKGSARRG